MPSTFVAQDQHHGDPNEKDASTDSSSWLFRPLGRGTNHHDAEPASSADQSAATSGQSSAGQTTPGAAANSAANSVTVDGCLAGSGSSYTLKDKTSGVTYQLAGDTAKLAPHVGHELQLTGTTSTGSASATAGGATSATPTASTSGGSSPTLNMMSGKVLSNTCSAQ